MFARHTEVLCETHLARRLEFLGLVSVSTYIVRKDYRNNKYIVHNWDRNFDSS
jgi:hypothetical protein